MVHLSRLYEKVQNGFICRTTDTSREGVKNIFSRKKKKKKQPQKPVL